MATDPICGMQVIEETAKNTSVFEGKNYYFCSAGCKKKFDADPASHAGKPAPAGGAHDAAHHHHAHAAPAAPAVTGGAQQAAVYTCPMHPEVRSPKPGSCPKCGMPLVLVAGTGSGVDDDSELRDLTRRLWIGTALSIPLVILAMSPMVGLHDLVRPAAEGRAAGSNSRSAPRSCCGSAGRS